MSEIMVNIIPFQGRPFENPITLLKFKASDSLNWHQLGFRIRQIRARLRGSDCLVFQFNRSMISTRDLTDIIELKDLLGEFRQVETINVSIDTEEDREILKRLVGESISHQLRSDMRNSYKIMERPNAVYYASNPTEIEGFGELDVYKGFIFVPLVQEGGQVGIMLDPRSKYHTKENIRKFLGANNQEKWLTELDYSHVDICPVTWCVEKFDPLSPCDLSHSGKSIKIVSFVNDLPTKTKSVV